MDALPIMMRSPLVRVSAIALFVVLTGCNPSPISVQEVYTPLCNGQTLDGWESTPKGSIHWSVNDGILAFDGTKDDLWTVNDYEDFELSIRWRWAGDHQGKRQQPLINSDGSYQLDSKGDRVTVEIEERDSGIFLRGNSKSQVNIWEWPAGSGEVYGYRTDSSMPDETRSRATPLRRADKPVYEWNRFIIRLIGENLDVWLNDVHVIQDCPLPGIPDSGPIGLQAHGSAIEFKDIEILMLPK